MIEHTTVAAYCRVSTKHDDQLNSLGAQLSYYNDYVNKNNNMQLHEVYHDTLSATNWEKRQGFKKMLHDAGLDIEVSRRGNLLLEISERPPLFNRILVKDVSRFARNIDSVDIIRKLRDKRVFIDFTNMNLSTENMSEDMMLGMFILFAERESKDRSEKILWGLERSAEQGRIRVRDNYYGYRYLKDTRELEIVEEEAEVVRLMFSLYNKGFGVRRLIQELDRLGHKTREGKSFCPTTIRRMLTNPAFFGTLVRNKMDSPLVFTSKRSATEKEESKWKIHEGVIPAIIDKETFDLAQSIRKQKLHHRQRVGIKPSTSIYSKLLFCEQCGNNYTKNRERRTGRDFMNCRTKKVYGVSKCSSPNIGCNLIDKAINDFAKNRIEESILKFKKNYISELLEFKKELEGRIDNQHTEKADSLKIELQQLNDQEKKIIKLYSMGKYDEETLDELMLEITQERDRLQNDLNICSSSNEEIIKEIEEVDIVISQIEQFKNDAVYSDTEAIELIDLIRVQEIQSNQKNKRRVLLIFEFKVFKKLNQLVDKYAEINKVTTDNSVYVPYDLY
ncbi:recombinase family protein [Paenibacillus sp. JSM ZJ436]|uniref:recombinase family protein n=1 Tax=Paenibacillus sp. JSM ZJ436 TaxID=3376190 RepID=UPI0037B73AE2